MCVLLCLHFANGLSIYQDLHSRYITEKGPHFAAARSVELCCPIMGTEMRKTLFDTEKRYADIYIYIYILHINCILMSLVIIRNSVK